MKIGTYTNYAFNNVSVLKTSMNFKQLPLYFLEFNAYYF